VEEIFARFVICVGETMSVLVGTVDVVVEGVAEVTVVVVLILVDRMAVVALIFDELKMAETMISVLVGAVDLAVEEEVSGLIFVGFGVGGWVVLVLVAVVEVVELVVVVEVVELVVVVGTVFVDAFAQAGLCDVCDVCDVDWVVLVLVAVVGTVFVDTFAQAGLCDVCDADWEVFVLV